MFGLKEGASITNFVNANNLFGDILLAYFETQGYRFKAVYRFLIIRQSLDILTLLLSYFSI